jgi:hypothetical protein
MRFIWRRNCCKETKSLHSRGSRGRQTALEQAPSHTFAVQLTPSGVQDKLVSQAQFGGIIHAFVGVIDLRIGGDTPGLMADHSAGVFACNPGIRGPRTTSAFRGMGGKRTSLLIITTLLPGKWTVVSKITDVTSDTSAQPMCRRPSTMSMCEAL